MTTLDSRDDELRPLMWAIQRQAHEAARILDRSDPRAVEVSRSFGYWLGRLALDERDLVASVIEEMMPSHRQADFTEAEWQGIADGLGTAIDEDSV